MLLQGYDFLWLAENEKCEPQVVIRSMGKHSPGSRSNSTEIGKTARHDLALLTKPDGSKYGKTAGERPFAERRENEPVSLLPVVDRC